MCSPSRGRPFNEAVSALARALQCGGVRCLNTLLDGLQCEHPNALDELISRATNWRKANPQTRAADLARWSVLNESLAWIISSDLLGGGDGRAVGELAELTARQVAGLVACGGPGEAACKTFGEFRELVHETAVDILCS
jgi:hypothetical protein